MASITSNETYNSMSDKGIRKLLLGQGESLEDVFTAFEIEQDHALFNRAKVVQETYYGRDIFTRAVIEFSSYCHNDCYYCGLRNSNAGVTRYRLTKRQILDCCTIAYVAGMRTFVLQSGEDDYFTDEVLCPIVSEIAKKWPDCAITLSCGERSRASYKRLFEAGATRYLLKIETSDSHLYKRLHPMEILYENRLVCLYNLKDIGYCIGSGFLVGVPFQTIEHIIKDLHFLKNLQPDMIATGPFVPCTGTPFEKFKSGPALLSLRVIALTRLMSPGALIPAVSALGSVASSKQFGARSFALGHGANVIMHNFTPEALKKEFRLYDGKAIEGNITIPFGYQTVVSKGDAVKNIPQ